MRSLAFVFLGLATATAALAAEITLPLTSQSVTHWTVSGASPDQLSGEPLTLPAGAQLSRSFTAESLAIDLDAKAVFAPEPENWPVVELGTAALVFARDGNTGILVLAVGADQVVLHPAIIPLAADGFSSEPVKAVLRRDGSTVSLIAAGQRIELPAPADDPLTVMVSTGAGQPWAFERFAVNLWIPDGEFPSVLLDEAGETSSSGPAKNNAGSSSSSGAHAGGSADEVETSQKTSAGPPASYRPLEIYTPPAVRSHRAEQIKAAVKALRRQ